MSILGGDSTTSTGGSIGIETGHSTGTYDHVYMSLFVYVYVRVCMYVGNVIECMCEHCLFVGINLKKKKKEKDVYILAAFT